MKNLTTIDLAALSTVTGGDGNPPTQPNLSCPAGTSPEWTRVTGNVEGKTPVGVGISGQGSYETFSCKPLPKQN